MSDAVAEVIERIGCPRCLTFNPQDWAILAKCWYPVARSDELGERPIQVQLLDVDLVVYRAAGKAVVARNLCVHRGTRLSLGWVEDDAIVCPYHGQRACSRVACVPLEIASSSSWR
jgi:phenylpropionate dioxygenase-like ring-hydroxylating dioxygenase large terminal subunit